jgi:hypothetical protein
MEDKAKAPSPKAEEVVARKPAPPPAKPAWTVGTWGGHPNYECSRCPFKTLDKAAAAEHVLRRHGVKETA